MNENWYGDNDIDDSINDDNINDDNISDGSINDDNIDDVKVNEERSVGHFSFHSKLIFSVTTFAEINGSGNIWKKSSNILED